MNNTNTARERIREITFSLATGARVVLPTEMPEALDAYRDEVLAEAAEIARANCHLQPGQCGCHTAADHILAARAETYSQKVERLRMAGARELSRRHAEAAARTTARHACDSCDGIDPDSCFMNRPEAAEESLPPWEAVYESATFTSRLLAYCQDETTARGAAEAWLRSQAPDVDGLVWTPDPQMAVREWDQWLSLSSTAEDGTPLDTEIAVRQRAARTTSAPTSRHCATPNSALPCGRHCRHDLCADCDRCCTCQCATAPTSQEQL